MKISWISRIIKNNLTKKSVLTVARHHNMIILFTPCLYPGLHVRHIETLSNFLQIKDATIQ